MCLYLKEELVSALDSKFNVVNPDKKPPKFIGYIERARRDIEEQVDKEAMAELQVAIDKADQDITNKVISKLDNVFLRLIVGLQEFNNNCHYSSDGNVDQCSFSFIDHITGTSTTLPMTTVFSEYILAVGQYRALAVENIKKHRASKKKAKDFKNGSLVRLIQKDRIGKEVIFNGRILNNSSRQGDEMVVVEWDINFLCSIHNVNDLEIQSVSK
jgi:hypothetical protein